MHNRQRGICAKHAEPFEHVRGMATIFRRHVENPNDVAQPPCARNLIYCITLSNASARLVGGELSVAPLFGESIFLFRVAASDRLVMRNGRLTRVRIVLVASKASLPDQCEALLRTLFHG